MGTSSKAEILRSRLRERVVRKKNEAREEHVRGTKKKIVEFQVLTAQAESLVADIDKVAAKILLDQDEEAKHLDEVFDRVTAPAFLSNVEARGAELKTALREKLAGHPHLKDVRGSGLLVGVQFDVAAAPLVAALRKDGLLTLTAGAGDVLRLVPPLIVTSADVQKASDMIATRAFDVLK